MEKANPVSIPQGELGVPGGVEQRGLPDREISGQDRAAQGNPFLGRVLTPGLPNLQNIVSISK